MLLGIGRRMNEFPLKTSLWKRVNPDEANPYCSGAV